MFNLDLLFFSLLQEVKVRWARISLLGLPKYINHGLLDVPGPVGVLQDVELIPSRTATKSFL